MNIYCFSTLSFAKLQFKSVINKVFHKHGVASFTDAWIETNLVIWYWPNFKSHLLQMRGLKPGRNRAWRLQVESHLLQMRGLKLQGSGHWPGAAVASFTDAWIETPRWPICGRKGSSRIFYRCVDWNKRQPEQLRKPRASHLLQMRGLKQSRLEWNL